MRTQIFALRVEPDRLVAAEVTDEVAATLLEAGEQILLGTFEELGNLAVRLLRPLLLISRASARPGSVRCQTAAPPAGQHPSARLPEADLAPLEQGHVGSRCGAAGSERSVAVSAARVA